VLLLAARRLEYIASPKVQLIRERSFSYMSKSVPITVAHGDGIGPEIMAATLHILKEAGANLETKQGKRLNGNSILG